MSLLIDATHASHEDRHEATAEITDPITGDVVVSAILCGTILTLFFATTPDTLHWFSIPIFLCGVLVGLDLVRMVRGKVDLFTPIGFLSVISFHFFFLAPLLHVRTGYWMQYVDTSGVDWRIWMGRMAFINLLGLGGFYLVRQIVLNRRAVRENERIGTLWFIDSQRFVVFAALFLVVAGALQTYVFASFGGVAGYISAYETRTDAFDGMGIIVMFSESFPIVAMMVFVLWAGKDVRRQHWPLLLGGLVVFVAVQFLFGGLRGSRSNTIWALFWAVGLVHLWIRAVPRKFLVAGALCVLVFMYLYGFYKTLGTDAFELLDQPGGFASVQQQSGRSLESLLLLDLGRTDVQAYLLYQMSPKPEGVDYEYARGATYVGAATLLIPRQLFPEKPPTKVAAGTDALYGEGTYENSSLRASRVYGLAGESMLNFGVFAVPVAYALFGGFVGFAQQWIHKLHHHDSRRMLVPLLITGLLYLLVWDSDNLVFFLFKNGLVPVLLITISSRKISVNNSPPAVESSVIHHRLQ